MNRDIHIIPKMKVFLCLLFLGFAIKIQSNELPKSTPSAQGVSSKGILDFINAADENRNGIHSFVLMRNGFVIAEASWKPYRQDVDHMLFSVSKSFTSTAIGLAMGEGVLSLEDRVVDFFPNEVPENASSNLKAMRIRDLLSMSSGHNYDAIRRFSFSSKESLTSQFLHLSVAHKPGTHFAYNTPASFMCSAILQKATGQTLLDYLKARLFKPIGIQSPRWSQSAQGISHGGFGLNISTEDIARFGQLYLQNGKWNGKQIVSADWIAMATSRQIANAGNDSQSDWEQGYGFQFWRSRHNAFRGDGIFGQFCLVMPDQNAVIAITSGTRDMGAILKLVWKHLLPAFDSAETKDLTKQLKDRIEKLELPTIHELHENDSDFQKVFQLDKNDLGWRKLHLEKSPLEKYKYRLTLIDSHGTDLMIDCSPNVWLRDETKLSIGIVKRIQDRLVHPIATTGGWVSTNEFKMKMAFTETPLVIEMQLRFEGEKILLDISQSASFGPSSLPSIRGSVIDNLGN